MFHSYNLSQQGQKSSQFNINIVPGGGGGGKTRRNLKTVPHFPDNFDLINI